MKSEPVVQLRNVTKKIGLKTIIHPISLDIHKGKVFGLLGSNGAGKTTIIRMIVGLASITQGQITIHGANVKYEFEKAIQHVGAIVENPQMYTYLSGYRNLIHTANMLPHVDRKRIKEVIALVGLEKSIHQKVKTYSLGMKQRLGSDVTIALQVDDLEEAYAALTTAPLDISCTLKDQTLTVKLANDQIPRVVFFADCPRQLFCSVHGDHLDGVYEA